MRRHHRVRGPLLVLVASFSIAAGLCAAPSAQADAPGPVVSFLDTAAGGTGYRWLSVAAPDGSGPARLTAAGYDSYSYDVSEDGNTMVVGLATNSWKANYYDRVYALMYVHRDGDVITSHVLANEWDAEPSLSADGSTAWWMSHGVIWKYAAGTVSAASGSAFAPAKGEQVIGFSVSPDGTNAAVVYYRDAITSRILVADMANLRTDPYYEMAFTAAQQLTSQTPVWVDDARVLVGTKWDGVYSVSLVTYGPPMGLPNEIATDVYDIQNIASDWWAWSDSGGVTS